MSGVTLKIVDGVAVITLENKTKLNALTIKMLDALYNFVDQIEHDSEVHCLILTGAGDKAFCSGADIVAWEHLSPVDFARHWVRNGHRIFDRLANCCKPTIAVINGHAFGGGVELASACDIRIMAGSATLSLPEARVGVVPGWSGTQRLLRLLPESVLKESALFGRRITASRALSFGYVAELSDNPMAIAIEIASGLLELSPRSTEVTKSMLHAAANEDKDAAIEALGAAAISTTNDRVIGVAAFHDKTKPVFSGK